MYAVVYQHASLQMQFMIPVQQVNVKKAERRITKSIYYRIENFLEL